MATLMIVRHAKATNRDKWNGPDRDRPLARRGREQAAKLARYVGSERPAVVASSPWLRCVQTAEPMADAAGLEVVTDARLGYDATDFRAWVVETLAVHPGANLVMVSHGDLIPEFLFDAGLVQGQGYEQLRTGSLYRVTIDGGRLRSPATYVDRDELADLDDA